jgi:hypothetical protein
MGDREFAEVLHMDLANRIAVLAPADAYEEHPDPEPPAIPEPPESQGVVDLDSADDADGADGAGDVDNVGEDQPAETGFDPGMHSVIEVKAYLREHPDEKDAVLERERAGDARKSILDYV